MWLLHLVLAATPTSLDLTWVAPAECQSREDVEALVARWAPGVTRPLKASASTRREGATFVLVLETDSGRRELRSDRCDEVTHGAALVLAMLLDAAVAPTAMAVSPPAPRPPPTTSTTGEQPTPQRAPWSGLLRGGVMVDVGALPVATAGWRLTAGVAFRSFIAELSSGAFLAQRLPIPQVAGAQAQLSLDFDVLLRGCWAPGEARVRPRVCGAATVGQLSGTGLGLTAPRTERSRFAAVFVGMGAHLELRWGFGLLVHLELGVPLVRTNVVIDGQPSVFTTPWLLTRAEAGLEWRFP